MAVSRRRLLQSVALTSGCGTAAEAAESTTSLDALRSVSTAHGTNFTDDRLRVVVPVLEGRRPQLQALRDFAIDDTVAPVQGILDK